MMCCLPKWMNVFTSSTMRVTGVITSSRTCRSTADIDFVLDLTDPEDEEATSFASSNGPTSTSTSSPLPTVPSCFSSPATKFFSSSTSTTPCTATSSSLPLSPPCLFKKRSFLKGARVLLCGTGSSDAHRQRLRHNAIAAPSENGVIIMAASPMMV